MIKEICNNIPDANGNFGVYGGAYIPDFLKVHFEEITEKYMKIREDENFISELKDIRKNYQGRPTPLYYAERLSELYGAALYLKREDLNHTGAHKINHCMAEVLLARYLGKKKVIAETGAGQHGVALATAAAYFGLDCEIHMGETDMKKESPNVLRMRILGAEVVPVRTNRKDLKEAVDSAFEAYVKDPVNSIYCIGSVVGPHPFPVMVRDFQSIVGEEAREQFFEIEKSVPDSLIACVGGGSNAIGLFRAFLGEKCDMYGVEPAGKSFRPGEHAATLTYGKEGIIHGFKCYLLQEEDGSPMPVYSIASGLDYPGVGPEHSFLKDSGRVQYRTINDQECIKAFFDLSRQEGIIPALESAHAVAYAEKLAKERPGSSILINLSGRGDKDLEFINSLGLVKE